MKNGLVKNKYGDTYIKRWYKDDLLHRENGPAIESANGSKEWWINGQRHRIDGPAIKYSTGHKEWYINGKCHRLDGPALEFANGNKYWYYQGKFIDCKSQEEFERIINLLAFG